jgi:dTDP-4-dehydrorhamnose reductase
MRILITGAAGMLGGSLVPELTRHDHAVLATDIRHLGPDMKHLDARDGEEMMRIAKKFRPDMLMHLAAETDLEVCETKVDYAYEENFVSTQNAVMVCRELSIPLTYISTAGVFDGKKSQPYTEFDEPNPINVYGDSKYQGEQIVRTTMPNHFILRAGWMIGGGERDKKFVSKIMKQLDEGSRTIYAVKDKLGTPTYAPAFSKVLQKIVKTGYFGTYHLACKGRATRYDVAKHILRTLGRKDVELKAVNSSYFRKEYFAPRPRSEEMRNYVLDLRGMNEMPQWEDALEVYLKKSFSSYFR